jgi:hypothetical protein
MVKNKTYIYIALGIVTLGIAYFVFRKKTPFKKAVVEEADKEWRRWGMQTRDKDGNWIKIGGKENKGGFIARVGQYWKNLGWNDVDGSSPDHYWSSAFISWIMGGVGRAFGVPFKETHRHSNYIQEYVQNRKQGNLNADYVAYRLHEKPAEVGDLVCYAREDTEDDPYDRTSKYASHCDIVVKKTKDEIEVIGGNVGNSVSKKVLRAIDGYVVDDNNRWFAVIKNNA